MCYKNFNISLTTIFNAILLITLIDIVKCYKILGIFPHAGKSHFDVVQPIFFELAKRGHQITIIGHFPLQKPLANYQDVSLAGTSKLGRNKLPFGALGDTGGQSIGRYTHMLELAWFTNDICEKGFESEDLQNFVAKKQKFDVVITEFFTTNCFLGLMKNTGGSLIGVTSSGVLPWVNDYMGNPDNPSYIPLTHMGFAYTHMNFRERVENVLGYLVYKIFFEILIDWPTNADAKKYIDKNLSELDDYVYNASLVLANIHYTVHGPKPYVPGIVEVGGVHIGKPKKLPQNIEKFINESTHGVIYFSMGSMIKGDTFPEDKRKIFQKVFARFKQRVLWKWENDTMPGKTDNIMIQSWMPQFDILCHPNVKAFITHGGLLGTTESVHCGVPAIVMPQFGDQYTNARALEASGGGVVLHFSTITEEDVYNALKTVLDPSFNKKAKELSARFKDRPMSPMDTAIYWVEYVARHKGAPHLRSAAVGMPYYQYLLLDVIAFLLLVTFIIFYIFYRILKFIFKKLFSKKTTKVKKQ